MTSSIKRVAAKRQLQQFSVQDKLDAIQRVNEGESKASVARDIGVPESTLRGWCKSEDKLRSSATEVENQGVTDLSVGGGIHSMNGALDCGPSRKRAVHDKDPELDEALWFWLRQQQQHVAGLTEQLCAPTVKSSSAAVAAAAAAVAATGAVMSSPVADLNPGSGWFWRWYKRYGLATPDPMGKNLKLGDGPLPLLTTNRAQPTPIAAAPVPPPPAPMHHIPAPLPAAPAPLLASAAVEEPSDEDEDDEPPLSAAEAVAHGEKFLRWLDCCSDPSVTALQILQFRYLLNNVRACAARRAKAAASRDKS